MPDLVVALFRCNVAEPAASLVLFTIPADCTDLLRDSRYLTLCPMVGCEAVGFNSFQDLWQRVEFLSYKEIVNWIKG